MAILCLAAFSLVIYGFGNGDLAQGCNHDYTSACDLVFRARATTFVCVTWCSLFLAWELIDLKQSFFAVTRGKQQQRNNNNNNNKRRYGTQWMVTIWQNQFLFWGVVSGFVTIFPVLYIPVLNRVVFKHTGITWEWGVVFVTSFLFVLGVEGWKWGMRVVSRHYSLLAKEDGEQVGKEEHENVMV
jgi:P-type Na+/K+ transporter